jgi:protein gp37
MTELEYWADNNMPGDCALNIMREVGEWPLPNIVLGVSCSTQAEVDRDVPVLLGTPANRRVVSLEPLVERVTLTQVQSTDGAFEVNTLTGDHGVIRPLRGRSENHLAGVIVGGESGPCARPMHPDWVRGLRGECSAAGVKFFFKQWGEWCANFQLPDGTCESMSEINHLRGPDVLEAPNGKDPCPVFRVGAAKTGRFLDGRTHDELCWNTAERSAS